MRICYQIYKPKCDVILGLLIGRRGIPDGEVEIFRQPCVAVGKGIVDGTSSKMPHSRLFLAESGEPFEIVSYGENGQTRFLCRGILDAYRKIFRRTGLEGVSALHVRRTVAARLFERGADEDQIGEVLGISEMKSVRELLPKVRQPL